ncbi:MAG: pentapeptide repeat-containing protein [Cyanobacteria bacterium P01_D01_bin.6]
MLVRHRFLAKNASKSHIHFLASKRLIAIVGAIGLIIALTQIELFLGKEQSCSSNEFWLICDLEGSVFIETAETFGFLVAIILFALEAPDRQKQAIYDAFKTIDAAKGIETSYARIAALQYLHRVGHKFHGLDLIGADLNNIELEGAQFVEANFEKVLLRGANLRKANFKDAILVGADCQNAHLEGVNFKGANLENANFQGANLRNADFRGANIRGVNLDKAFLEGTRGLDSQVVQLAKTIPGTREFQDKYPKTSRHKKSLWREVHRQGRHWLEQLL